MKIANLINKRVKQQFDLMFILVSDIQNSFVLLDKFYVNKNQYDSFAEYVSRDGATDGAWSYSYEYHSQKVELDELVSLFGLSYQTANLNYLVDELNGKLKNYAISLKGKEPEIITAYEGRMIVNSYFDERKYILEKTNESFPFSFENIEEFDSIIFRMYNVGQANMSALLVEKDVDRPVAIFDLGKSRKCKEAIDLLENKLPLMDSGKTTSIVISHFDNDHINMAEYLPFRGHSLQFLLPEFLHSSDIYKPNIQLLLYRAFENGNRVCVFLNEGLSNPVTKGFMTFLQGAKHKCDINQSTDENSHGLVVNLTANNKTIIIPGDVLYEDIFTDLASPLTPDYVIVPHHACKYLGNINPRILDLTILKESFTFCGPHGGYYHPNFTHFQHYMTGNSKLIRLSRNKSKYPTVFNNNIRIVDSYYVANSTQYYDWKLK